MTDPKNTQPDETIFTVVSAPSDTVEDLSEEIAIIESYAQIRREEGFSDEADIASICDDVTDEEIDATIAEIEASIAELAKAGITVDLADVPAELDRRYRENLINTLSTMPWTRVVEIGELVLSDVLAAMDGQPDEAILGIPYRDRLLAGAALMDDAMARPLWHQVCVDAAHAFRLAHDENYFAELDARLTDAQLKVQLDELPMVFSDPLSLARRHLGI